MNRKLSQQQEDHNLLSQMLDPKALAGIKIPKMLQTCGLDRKWFNPKNSGTGSQAPSVYGD